MNSKKVQEDYDEGMDWMDLKRKYNLQSNQLRAALKDRNPIKPDYPLSLRREVIEVYRPREGRYTKHRVLESVDKP